MSSTSMRPMRFLAFLLVASSPSFARADFDGRGRLLGQVRTSLEHYRVRVEQVVGELPPYETDEDAWFAGEGTTWSACYYYGRDGGNFYPWRLPALVAADYVGRILLPSILDAAGASELATPLRALAPARNHLQVQAMADLARSTGRALRARAAPGPEGRPARQAAAMAQRVWAAVMPLRRVRAAPVRTTFDRLGDAFAFAMEVDISSTQRAAVEMFAEIERALVSTNVRNLQRNCEPSAR